MIYVVIIDDRHAEADVELWADKEAAINRARSIAQERCSYPEGYEESDIKGWLFYASYSCESDCVWVVEKELKNNPHQQEL